MKSMMLPLTVLAILVIGSVSFAWQGISMHHKVIKEEVAFHALQESYFTLAKSEREAAPSGSELNKQLVAIQNYPSSLMELKLLGVGKILTGIFGLLLGILLVLFMMPIRLAKLMKST